jgi:hypothetical protein
MANANKFKYLLKSKENVIPLKNKEVTKGHWRVATERGSRKKPS